MKVERELCKNCRHVEDFHLVRPASGKTQCIEGHEIRYRNEEWKETLKPIKGEHGCYCRKFEP